MKAKYTLISGLALSALTFTTAFGMMAASGLEVDPNEAVIVSADRSTERAAAELQTNLLVMTGVKIPVVKAAEEGRFAFSFFKKDFPENEETAKWRVKGNGVFFAGNYEFAVAEFLENELGIRWPEGDLISAPESKKIVIRSNGGDFVPELKIRGIRREKSSKRAGVFARRMREGRHAAPKYGHAFSGHWAKYGKDHRDYFAMRKDGVRGPWNAKPAELMGNIAVYAADTGATLAMCCTSTGLVNQIIADWDQAGRPEYINLCENDVPGQNSCQCPSCKALDVVPAVVNPQWGNYFADRYVYFGNRVLAAARKLRPDVKVSYYAYNATTLAPARERPASGSVIGLVPTYFSLPYLEKYVGDWKKAGGNTFFYRPNRHHYFRRAYIPCGAEEHFFKVLQLLVKAGTIGFDYDAPSPENLSYDYHERYILEHAMQDPSKSFDHWEDQYCQAYGAAKDDVKAYFRYFRENVWNPRFENDLDAIADRGKWFNIGREVQRHLGGYLKAADYAAAEKFLAAAEAKAAKLSASQREALGRLRLTHDHAVLLYRAVAEKSKANTEALVAFRRAHDIPLYRWEEQHFGDVTGVEGLLGPKPKNK